MMAGNFSHLPLLCDNKSSHAKVHLLLLPLLIDQISLFLHPSPHSSLFIILEQLEVNSFLRGLLLAFKYLNSVL